MSAARLTHAENALVRKCLQAAADGPFFPDWEFETLMGVTRKEVRELSTSWPVVDEERRANEIAASALNNLLGYPHDQERAITSLVGAPRAELERLTDRLVAASIDRE